MEVNPSNTPPVEQTPFIPPHANTYKKALFVVLLILLLGTACVLYLNGSRKIEYQAEPKPTEAVCTQDAMICPDGSTVGRSGPDCKFVCPTPIDSAQEFTTHGLTFQVPEGWYFPEFMRTDAEQIVFEQNITISKVTKDGIKGDGLSPVSIGFINKDAFIQVSKDLEDSTPITLGKFTGFRSLQVVDKNQPIFYGDVGGSYALQNADGVTIYASFYDYEVGKEARTASQEALESILKSAKKEDGSTNTLAISVLADIRTLLGKDQWLTTDSMGKGKCEPSAGAVPDQPELIFDACIESFEALDPVASLTAAGWKVTQSYNSSYEGVSYPTTTVMQKGTSIPLLYVVKMVAKGTTIIQTAK